MLPRRLGKGGKPPFAIPRPVPVRARVGQAITCGHNKVAPSCLSRPKFGSDGREDGREDGTSGVLSYNTLVGGGQALPPNPLPAIRTGGGKIVDGDRAGSDPAEPKREGRTYGICPRANPCATGETPAPPFRHGRAAHRNSLEGKFHECDVPDFVTRPYRLGDSSQSRWEGRGEAEAFSGLFFVPGSSTRLSGLGHGPRRQIFGTAPTSFGLIAGWPFAGSSASVG